MVLMGAGPALGVGSVVGSTRRCTRRVMVRCGGGDPLMVRAARGEAVERVPVWMYRQAGRYMADFRKFSDKIPFRERSETAEIAIELSLQPWKAFQTDGVIMFSDILTPLPAMGIEFDMVKGKGPVIGNPVRGMDEVDKMKPLDDPDASLPFIREILSSLRKEVGGEAAVFGFVGAPWTLAAYSVEGKSDKNLEVTKGMMFKSPGTLHALLQHLTEAIARYAVHQIDCGAQCVQLFESWAHHLSPEQLDEFALPYVKDIVGKIQAERPGVPVFYYCNGGSGKYTAVERAGLGNNVMGIDWCTSMADARGVFGDGMVLQGNVDPSVLKHGSEADIKAYAERALVQGGIKAGDGDVRGMILGCGHGVLQGTPEDNVKFFVQQAHNSRALFSP